MATIFTIISKAKKKKIKWSEYLRMEHLKVLHSLLSLHGSYMPSVKQLRRMMVMLILSNHLYVCECVYVFSFKFDVSFQYIYKFFLYFYNFLCFSSFRWLQGSLRYIDVHRFLFNGFIRRCRCSVLCSFCCIQCSSIHDDL